MRRSAPVPAVLLLASVLLPGGGTLLSTPYIVTAWKHSSRSSSKTHAHHQGFSPMKFDLRKTSSRQGPCFVLKALKRKETARASEVDMEEAETDSRMNSKQFNDERWNDNFERLVAFKTKHNHTRVPGRYIMDHHEEDGSPSFPLGKWVDYQKNEYRVYQRTKGIQGKITPARIAKLNSIKFEWAPGKQDQLDEAWNEMFHELATFQQTYNSTKVPRFASKKDNYNKNNNYDPLFRKLNNWVRVQRSHYNKLTTRNETNNNQLTPDRLRRLESIGMSWSSNAVTDDDKWLRYYFKLLSLQHQHNTTDVPQHYDQYRGLANWVLKQKHGYDEYCTRTTGDEGRALIMTQWRFGLLQSIDFERMRTGTLPSDGRLSNEERWNMMYTKLLAFKEKYKSTLVPNYWEEDPSLGTWVRTQRTKFGRFAHILTSATELDGRSIKLDVPLRERLRTAIAEAFDYDENGVMVENMEHRILRLQDIGFVWCSSEEQWKDKYRRLVVFQKEHNSTLVPGDYDVDPELGKWVWQQRRLYGEFANIGNRSGDLNTAISQTFNYTYPGQAKIGLTVESRMNRIALLNDIGFVWDPLEEQWMANFRELRAYVKRFNSTLVPERYRADIGLGYWVAAQRGAYKRKMLSKERRRLLDSTGFVWDAVSCTSQG